MLTSPDNVARQTLEDTFFRNVDSMILSRLQNEPDPDCAKQALSNLTGLKDPVLLRELVQLGITPPGLVSIHLAPLVLVAWAQNGISAAERKTIIAQSRSYGIQDGSVASILLEHWLNYRPPATLYDAWKRFTLNELSQMKKRPKEKLTRLIETQMVAVAKASGGHFGIGKISSEQQKLINRATAVLHNAVDE